MSSPPGLSGEINFRVHDPHVPRQRVVSRKRLLLGAQVTADFLLARIVYRVLVPGEVVRPREDGVARFARRRIDALAFVWSRLAVPH